MIRQLFQFHGGLKLPGHKQESTTLPIAPARLPRRLTVPLQQHIGVPAEPVVAAGDVVLKGQLIARASDQLCAPVHAPSSGTVVDIGDYPVPHPSGQTARCIVIDTDGLETRADPLPPIHDWHHLSAPELRERIRQAGIVGLGGAGFPSFIKLNPGQAQVETLILNGAECEPYITCDDMLMRERAQEIIQGLLIIRHALQARRCLIGLEDNKPEAREALQQAIQALAPGAPIEVVMVPTVYPGGGEKQLIYELTGQEVPSGKLPLALHVVCHNVGTAAAVYRAIVRGEPLISRIVTVTGAVGAPRNLEVLIGTPVRELVEQCGGNFGAIRSTVMGGPMMGFTLHDLGQPVIKTTNCVLTRASAQRTAQQAPTLPCIRCSACADACPMSLLPQQLYWYARAKELDRVKEYHVADCIECGCCDYVCPSQIPLVQYYRFAKAEIATQTREKAKSEVARVRFESRQARLDREKAEREARHKQKAQALAEGADAGDQSKQAAIQQAVERAQAKREETSAAETKVVES